MQSFSVKFLGITKRYKAENDHDERRIRNLDDKMIYSRVIVLRLTSLGMSPPPVAEDSA